MNNVHEGEQDYWKFDEQCMVRIHRSPRRNLCTPFQCRGAPESSGLTSTRVTHGRYDDGITFLKQDNWTCKTSSTFDMGRPWMGRTVFVPKVSCVYSVDSTADPDPTPLHGDSDTRSQMLVRKQQELWRKCLVGKDYGSIIRAQVLTRGIKEIMKNNPRASKGSPCSVTRVRKSQLMRDLGHHDPSHSPEITFSIIDDKVEDHVQSLRALRGRGACARAGTRPMPGRYPLPSASKPLTYDSRRTSIRCAHAICFSQVLVLERLAQCRADIYIYIYNDHASRSMGSPCDGMPCRTKARAEEDSAAAISDGFDKHINRLCDRVPLEVQSLLVRIDRPHPGARCTVPKCNEKACDAPQRAMDGCETTPYRAFRASGKENVCHYEWSQAWDERLSRTQRGSRGAETFQESMVKDCHVETPLMQVPAFEPQIVDKRETTMTPSFGSIPSGVVSVSSDSGGPAGKIEIAFGLPKAVEKGMIQPHNLKVDHALRERDRDAEVKERNEEGVNPVALSLQVWDGPVETSTGAYNMKLDNAFVELVNAILGKSNDSRCHEISAMCRGKE